MLGAINLMGNPSKQECITISHRQNKLNWKIQFSKKHKIIKWSGLTLSKLFLDVPGPKDCKSDMATEASDIIYGPFPVESPAQDHQGDGLQSFFPTLPLL